ncbi:Ammonium transporter NrgA [compost metagenome]
MFATPELAETTGVGKAGLFYGGGFEQVGVQILGVIGTFAFVFVLSYGILWAMKFFMGLRVTEEEEMMGLDISEHGTYGYPEQMSLLNSKVVSGNKNSDFGA